MTCQPLVRVGRICEWWLRQKLTLLSAEYFYTIQPLIISLWLRSIRMSFATYSVAGHCRTHDVATVGTGSGYTVTGKFSAFGMSTCMWMDRCLWLDALTRNTTERCRELFAAAINYPPRIGQDKLLHTIAFHGLFWENDRLRCHCYWTCQSYTRQALVVKSSTSLDLAIKL